MIGHATYDCTKSNGVRASDPPHRLATSFGGIGDRWQNRGCATALEHLAVPRVVGGPPHKCGRQGAVGPHTPAMLAHSRCQGSPLLLLLRLLSVLALP